MKGRLVLRRVRVGIGGRKWLSCHRTPPPGPAPKGGQGGPWMLHKEGSPPEYWKVEEGDPEGAGWAIQLKCVELFYQLRAEHIAGWYPAAFLRTVTLPFCQILKAPLPLSGVQKAADTECGSTLNLQCFQHRWICQSPLQRTPEHWPECENAV